jgi:hypothetical protein
MRLERDLARIRAELLARAGRVRQPLPARFRQIESRLLAMAVLLDRELASAETVEVAAVLRSVRWRRRCRRRWRRSSRGDRRSLGRSCCGSTGR